MKKHMITILALMLSQMSNAATDLDSSAGLYTDCVKWTTVNDIEHSKGFRYRLNEDDTMSMDVLYYTGTDKCEGHGESLMHAKNFTVQKKVAHKDKVFILIVRNEDTGDYYQIMFSKDTAIIHISDALPIKYDINRTLLLKKAQ